MRAVIVFALGLLAAWSAFADERYDSWQPLRTEFPSTGGGGIMIRGYDPVVADGKCRTDFQAVEPNGTVYRNAVEFDAVAVAGGILCTNGRWRSLENDASGTTPFRVFIRDGVKRGSPD
jgi:hypothetical protein